MIRRAGIGALRRVGARCVAKDTHTSLPPPALTTLPLLLRPEYFCEKCLESHSKRRKTKDHAVQLLKVVAEEGGALPAVEVKCLIHKNEPMSIWCDTHNALLCTFCLVDKTHRDCDYAFVAAKAEEHRPAVGGHVRHAGERLAAMTGAVDTITEVEA